MQFLKSYLGSLKRRFITIRHPSVRLQLKQYLFTKWTHFSSTIHNLVQKTYWLKRPVQMLVVSLSSFLYVWTYTIVGNTLLVRATVIVCNSICSCSVRVLFCLRYLVTRHGNGRRIIFSFKFFIFIFQLTYEK